MITSNLEHCHNCDCPVETNQLIECYLCGSFVCEDCVIEPMPLPGGGFSHEVDICKGCHSRLGMEWD